MSRSVLARLTGSVVLAMTVSAGLATPAGAHVAFASPEVTAGGRGSAALRVGHGCNGSPTTEIAVTIPDGVTRVTPRALAGWTVTIEKRQLDVPVLINGFEVREVVSRIIWSGGSLPDDVYEEFDFRFTAPDTPGTVIYFPVEQKCQQGSWSWSSIPGPGERWEEMDTPAPFFRILPKPVTQ